jgi:hypothetical protein
LIAEATTTVTQDNFVFLISMIDVLLVDTNASAADAVAVAGFILYRAAEHLEEVIPGSLTEKSEPNFSNN